jgi:hypothetical protein
VRIEGTAELLTGHPSASEVPAYVAKHADAIKRIGHDPESFAGAYSEAIRVTPTNIR